MPECRAFKKPKKWISKLCRRNIFLSLPSEFKSETIKSSILQLLHGCTSQSLRTSDRKQLVRFSPPRQDLRFPRHRLYSPHSPHDPSSHLSACIWVGDWDAAFVAATEKPNISASSRCCSTLDKGPSPNRIIALPSCIHVKQPGLLTSRPALHRPPHPLLNPPYDRPCNPIKSTLEPNE